MDARPRPAWLPPPDGSRDRRVDDPTNVWVVHLVGRMLLPLVLRARIPANAVSVAGLAVGAGAAAAYLGRSDPAFATLGFLLCIGWLILDGLDGMVARATGTSSALGRFLDGAVDHGVFFLLYLAIVLTLDTPEAWITATLAGLFHGVQSNFYESERLRYRRRLRGDPDKRESPSPYRLARLYDRVAGSLDRAAARFDRALAVAPERRALLAAYAERAAAPLRLMNLLSANSRIILLYAACLAGDPRLFWWWEIGPLTLLTAMGIIWLRRVEARLA